MELQCGGGEIIIQVICQKQIHQWWNRSLFWKIIIETNEIYINLYSFIISIFMFLASHGDWWGAAGVMEQSDGAWLQPNRSGNCSLALHVHPLYIFVYIFTSLSSWVVEVEWVRCGNEWGPRTQSLRKPASNRQAAKKRSLCQCN